MTFARRFGLLLAALLVLAPVHASADAFAVASGAWGDDIWRDDSCGGGAPNATGEPASAEAWTICAGVTVNLVGPDDSNSGLSNGTINGTLNVTVEDGATSATTLSQAGSTTLAIGSTGTLNTTGKLILCSTTLGTCALAGQSVTGTALSKFVDYLNASGTQYRICTANACASGDNAYDAVIDDSILFSGDIDGNPTNDGSASARRPYFHVDIAVGANDYIQTTTAVGTGGTKAFTENTLSGARCYTMRTPFDEDSPWGGSSTTIQPIDYFSILCDPTTITATGQYVGREIQLSAAGADGTTYQVLAARNNDYTFDPDGGGAIPSQAYDRFIVWPAVAGHDYGKGTFCTHPCSTGQLTQAFWGLGEGTINPISGGAAEFAVFVPAQVMATAAGSVVTIASGGVWNADFTLNGPLEGTGDYGLKIDNNGGTFTPRYAWVNNTTGVDATSSCQVAVIQNGGTVQATHLMVSHDGEALNCGASDPATNGGPNAIDHEAGATTAGSLHFFNMAGVGLNIANANATDIDLDELTCVQQANSTGSVGFCSRVSANDAAGTMDIRIRKGGAWFWPGSTATRTGTATSTLMFHNCPNLVAPCGTETKIENWIYTPMLDSTGLSAIANDFTSVATGGPEDNLTIENSWFFDYRTTASNTLRQVWNGSGNTILFGAYGMSLGKKWTRNLMAHNYQGVSGREQAVTLLHEGPARAYQITKNVFLDAHPAGSGEEAIQCGIGGAGSNFDAPAGSSLLISNNHIALTGYSNAQAVGLSHCFDAADRRATIERNNIVNYRGAATCNSGWDTAFPPLATFNAIDHPDGDSNTNNYMSASCISGGTSAMVSLFYPNWLLHFPPRSTVGVGRLFAQDGTTRSIGANALAGATQTDWFTRNGITHMLQLGGGGGAASALRPILSPAGSP